MDMKDESKDNSVVVVGYNFYPSETTNDDSETTILGVFTSVELAHNFIKEWIRNNEISDGMEFFDEIHQLNPEA